MSFFRLWEDLHHVGDWQGAGNLRPDPKRFVPCHRRDERRHAVQRLHVLPGGNTRDGTCVMKAVEQLSAARLKQKREITQLGEGRKVEGSTREEDPRYSKQSLHKPNCSTGSGWIWTGFSQILTDCTCLGFTSSLITSELTQNLHFKNVYACSSPIIAVF